MKITAQQPLPPEVVIKEIDRLYEKILKTLRQKTWLEKIFSGGRL